MPRIINSDVMKVGDIVLTTSNERESKAVRIGTKADISHAMICVARSSVIDSTGEGVQARNIQKMFYDDNCSIHIMRLKAPLTEEDEQKMVHYLRHVIGTPYSLKEAVRSIYSPTKPGSDLQFCSRLAARAYEAIGINITANPDFCTPAEIKKSDLFYQVDSPFLQITEQEKNEILSNSSTVEAMHASINALLSKAKAVCPSSNILNISDIFVELLKNQALDSEFAKAFEESGFLERWKDEFNNYPWRYDTSLIEQFATEAPDLIPDLIRYCNATITDDDNGAFNHWKKNLEDYRAVYLSHQLKTLKLNLDLYENLWSLHTRRVEVAKYFIEKYQGRVR